VIDGGTQSSATQLNLHPGSLYSTTAVTSTPTGLAIAKTAKEDIVSRRSFIVCGFSRQHILGPITPFCVSQFPHVNISAKMDPRFSVQVRRA